MAVARPQPPPVPPGRLLALPINTVSLTVANNTNYSFRGQVIENRNHGDFNFFTPDRLLIRNQDGVQFLFSNVPDYGDFDFLLSDVDDTPIPNSPLNAVSYQGTVFIDFINRMSRLTFQQVFGPNVFQFRGTQFVEANNKVARITYEIIQVGNLSDLQQQSQFADSSTGVEFNPGFVNSPL